MSGWKKLAQAAAGSGGGLDVNDLFSTFLYKGTGSANTTITNDIDLSGEGGAVWLKNRSSNSPWYLVDTERGAGNVLRTNLLNSAYTDTSVISAFTSSGFTLGTDGDANSSLYTFSSWTFRKAPKFFDIVEYTGNSSNNRTIAHNLGSVPGMIIVKRKNANDSYWAVYHRGAFLGVNPQNYYGRWENPSDFATYASDAGYWNNTQPTSTHFSVGGPSGSSYNVNGSGGEFIAYLFAHNDGDGEFGPSGDQDIIKCGYYTGGAATDVTVDLGFEPQFLMIKASSNADWVVFDQMRGIGWSYSSDGRLRPSNSGSESYLEYLRINPNGFTLDANTNEANGYQDKYMYVAIRKGPMAVPEDVSKVFKPSVTKTNYSSTDYAFYSGFPVDSLFYKGVLNNISGNEWYDRLRPARLFTDDTTTQDSASTFIFDKSLGVWEYGGSTTTNNVAWMFRRAPEFFDVVGYEGTGSSSLTLDHNLGVVPEMMWVKRTSGTSDWKVYHKDLPNLNSYLRLNHAFASDNSQTNVWPTAPTATQFTIGNYTGDYTGGGDQGMAWLFATLSGISKVGSYSGNSGTQTIDCGFSNGAALVIIKRYDSSGAWFAWDSARGIVSGNDPYLLVNSTVAQETGYDAIDPHSSGFTLNNVGAGTNDSGSSYIFYAVAAP